MTDIAASCKPLERPPEKTWQDALADGRIMLQRNPDTDAHIFPPRIIRADGSGVEWVEASGNGTVYSCTVIRPRPPQEPYNVVLVDLEEGVRMMGRIERMAAEDVKIGMAVKAFIGEQGGDPVILFRAGI